MRLDMMFIGSSATVVRTSNGALRPLVEWRYDHTPREGMLMASAAMVIDRYSSPEALSLVASAPLVVCELIFMVTGGDPEHLALFRNGCRLKSSDAITTRERYAVVWVARSFTHSSFPQIGRAMAMDHSSIIRAFNRAKLFRRTDKGFRSFTDELARKLPRRHRVQRSFENVIEGVRP